MTFPLLLLLLGVSLSQAQVRIYDLHASDLHADPTSPPDAFVKVFYGSVSLGQTTIKNNDHNPWWPDEFSYFNAKENDVLRLEAIDKDVWFDDLMGVCQCQIKVGTHQHSCSLIRGTLHYTYTLNTSRQG